ncbi:MAG: sulfotransferase [Myxococcota bacterium]|nr:sulfotransferase [Myxococcota bacterium]
MIYVVLGMHKSGTTLISQTLHRSGISMGPEFDERVSYDAGNQWERRESWLINLEMLGAQEAQYYSLDFWKPPVGDRPEAVGTKIQELCQSAACEAEDWGFKDPLNCLTYAHWADILPPHRVIAIYRDPGEVMQHYGCRGWDLRRAWRVARAWSAYNEGILNAVSHLTSPTICLRYDAMMNGEAELNRLRAFVDRDLVDVRKASSYRARAGHPLSPPVGRLRGAMTGSNPTQTLLALDDLRRTALN